MDADNVGVEASTTNVEFSIRINPGAQAEYHNPARAPGKVAELYPVWIDGKIEDLKIPAGRVHPMPLTDDVKNVVDTLKKEVLSRFGTRTAVSTSYQEKVVLPPSPRQQIADAFSPYLPLETSFSEIQLAKNEGYIEGKAPTQEVAKAFVSALSKAPDVKYIQLAYTKPQDKEVFFRVLFNLACPTTGKTLNCKISDGGNEEKYDVNLIRTELQKLLGPEIKLISMEIKENRLNMEASATEAVAKTAKKRISEEAAWLRTSTSGIGNGSFSASMELLCEPIKKSQLGHLCQKPIK
jgi:hypothetical protein